MLIDVPILDYNLGFLVNDGGHALRDKEMTDSDCAYRQASLKSTMPTFCSITIQSSGANLAKQIRAFYSTLHLKNSVRQRTEHFRAEVCVDLSQEMLISAQKQRLEINLKE